MSFLNGFGLVVLVIDHLPDVSERASRTVDVLSSPKVGRRD